MKVNVKVTGMAEMQRTLQKLGKRGKDLAASGLYIEGERVMSASKQESPVGVDGVLRASGFVNRPEESGDGISVTLGYGGASANYAVAVHEGTRPHFPPVDALKPWARKFLGDENLAFAVARSIARKGTKATKYLERPLRAAAAGMGERLARHIRAGLGA